MLADVPLPSAPPGFKVTLFAKDPDLTHPTAMCAAPGGVVFVAQEYWNAKRPGVPETAVIKRFVDRDGDGVADEMKVFRGEGLRSVQGLRWFEGTLYAMHAPILSALRDRDGDGVAEERQDLLAGVHPDSRSRIAGHLISGVAVWIDGRLYITCGDEGWWKCRTPEDREFELHGGGILRCHPDGTGLEAYCVGLRNPYGTMAIDADGNGFTLDNTNDGQFVRFPGDPAWNERFSHIFRFGFYGYPYHFKNYPDECLPALEDYGGGSPTGGVCYLEDQFPAEYRGDLFINDWGRRMVSRFQLKDDGVVRRPVRTDFLTGGHGDGYDFRPIGIDVDENGNLLVADWCWGGWGWTNNPKGRIIRVTWTGDGGTGVTPPAPPAPKDVPGWAADLASPRFSVRFRAQRELERAGAAAAAALRETLAKGTVDARVHALWALARVEQAKAVPDLVKALADPEPRLRLHAARVLGDAGVGSGGVDALIARLAADDSPRLRLEAATALGNLGAARAAPALLKAAASDDVFVRRVTAQAVAATGDVSESLKALASPDARVREAALIALRERYELPVVQGLAKALKSHPDPAFRVALLRALVRVGKKPVPWDGQYWSFWPNTNQYPFGTVAWEGTTEIVRAVAAAIKDAHRDLRLQAAIGLRELRDEAGGAALAEALGNEADGDVLNEILAALETGKSAKAFKGLAALLRQAAKPMPLRLRALVVLGALEGLPEADEAARRTQVEAFLKSLASGGVDARLDALRGLAQARAVLAADWILGQLDDRDARVREAAIRALGDLKDARGVDRAKALLQDKAPEVRRAAVAAYAKLTAPKGDLAPLQALLRDPDFAVVREALMAFIQRKGDAAKTAAADLFTPFVRKWIVIGPFPNKEGKGFDAVYPPEQEIAPGREYDGDGGRVAWKPLDAGADILDLGKLVTDRPDVAAYAACVVEAAAETEVLLLTGSDDGVKIWINGDLVHLKNAGRAVKVDDDILRAKLRAGPNTILAKVENGGGAWALCLRLAVPQGSKTVSFPDPQEALGTARKTRLTETALKGGGDAAKGDAVFRGKKADCIRCHTVKGEGGKVGPDLTPIGAKYGRDHFAESILFPSRKLSQGFQGVSIITKDERLLSGIITTETPEQITLVGSDAKPVNVPKDEIGERHPQSVSIMPEGMENALTDEEFLDLMAFLESLK